MYKALLVDDEYMILKGLKKIIDWEECQVEIIGTANSGKQALDFVEEHEVDIVITDITMPVLSGIEFIHEARNRGFTFEFIVLTGYEEFEYAQKSVQLGATNYLLKPIDKIELEKSVRDVVEKLERKESNQDMSVRYYNQLLLNWIQGTQSYENVEKYMEKELLKPFTTPFTLISFKLDEDITSEKWEPLCKQFATHCVMNTNAKEGYLLLAETAKETVTQVLDKLSKEVNGKVQLFASSPVTDLKQIKHHTQELINIKDVVQFYELSPSVVLYADVEQSTEELKEQQHQLLQSILSREISVIQTETAAFLSLLEESKTDPKKVKQLSNNLITQSYLIFDALDSQTYTETIEAIYACRSYTSLKAILTEKLIPIKELSKNLLYSDTTRQVISIIQEAYTSDLKLKDVAKEVHVNTMYLGQLFKKETGKSFSTYLNNYRMDIAKQKLLQTNESISTISEQIGYQNHGYFYKLFKNRHDKSPKEYRDEFKQNLETFV